MEYIAAAAAASLIGAVIAYLVARQSGVKKEAQLSALNRQLTEELAKVRSEFEAIQAATNGFRDKIVVLETTNSHLNESIKQLKDEKALQQQSITKVTQQFESVQAEQIQLKSDWSALEARYNEITNVKQKLEQELSSLRLEKDQLSKDHIALQEQEPIRAQEHQRKLEQLNTVFQNTEAQRQRELDEKETAEQLRIKALSETWIRHESAVEQKIKLICEQVGLTYIGKEKFPHTGKPDNSILVRNQYVIFDSKSPQNDDLSNFAGYIRDQATAAKKYAKFEDVAKDVYLVVPTNAMSVIEDSYYPMGEYRVHVITVDSLVSILMNFKKIEGYEFAEELSPEDCDKIASVIGKMTYGMKRRVQIDQYFASEFISILNTAENIPKEILEKSQVVERSTILNPPSARRNKSLEIPTLTKDKERLNGNLDGQNIMTGPDLDAIQDLPLYKKASDK